MPDSEPPIPADRPTPTPLEQILAASHSPDLSQGAEEQYEQEPSTEPETPPHTKKSTKGRPRKNHDPKVVARARAASMARDLQRILEQEGSGAAAQWLAQQPEAPASSSSSPIVRAAWQEKVVVGLKLCPNLTFAAKWAGKERQTVADAIARDPEFRQRCDAAMRAGCELLEIHAIQRATEGVLEPVYHMGVVIDHVRKPSDTLLKTIRAARLPEQYGRQAGDVSVTVHHGEAAATPAAVLDVLQRLGAEAISAMTAGPQAKSEEVEA